ncbi:SBBP repeat-containing protein [Acidobacteriota bacterium]
MKKVPVVLLMLLAGLCFADNQNNTNMDLTNFTKKEIRVSPAIQPGYGNTPLYFIPNKGQVAEKALFYAKTPGYTMWITKKGFIFDSEVTRNDMSKLMFLDAKPDPEIVPIDMTRYKVNCFRGKDRSKWKHNIPTSKVVRYKNIYKNIDLKIYGIEKQIEYDWIVKPGGKPAEIKFEYKNVKATRIDIEGNLVIKTEAGEFFHKKPLSYQVKKAGRQVVDVRFKKIGKNTYAFSIGKYDPGRPLIIDPVVQLAYSTYLGGNNRDNGYAIAVDNNGCAYVTGETDSNNFPTENPFQPEPMGTSTDVFITKFTPAGDALEYSTFLGGNHSDKGLGIAVDDEGCAYITGRTVSTNFPVVNPIQENPAQGEQSDLFVCKLSADGSQLSFSTYLGGNESDLPLDIVLDSNSDVYITGFTGSHNFPTKNPFQAAHNGSYDAFVTKLSTANSTLVYSTYLGGLNVDVGGGIAVDTNGSAYITGFTGSSDFPTKKSYQVNRFGSFDAFVTKLSPDGTSIIYSTYLGGSKQEGWYYWGNGGAIAVDGSGCAYVAGRTRSPDFPVKNPFQGTLAGDWDVFITKLIPDGTDLEFSTYIGGGRDDYISGIAVDNRGYIHAAGETSGASFPIKKAFQVEHKGGKKKYGPDLFVLKMSPSGNALIYSTYLGSTNNDFCGGIAVDNNGYAYVTGDMTLKWGPSFPTKAPFQEVYGGGYNDAFVAKLVDDFPPTLSLTSPDNGAFLSGTILIRAEAEDDVGVERVDFYLDGSLVYSDKKTPYEYEWVSYHFPNSSYTIKAEAVDTEEHKSADEIMVTTQNVILTLDVERKVEQAWLIRKYYGTIDLNAANPGSLIVKKYIVYRKESGTKYQPLKEIPGSELSGGSYSFNDTYLEKDKTYSYKAIAYDRNGSIMAISEEGNTSQSMNKKKQASISQ